MCVAPKRRCLNSLLWRKARTKEVIGREENAHRSSLPARALRSFPSSSSRACCFVVSRFLLSLSLGKTWGGGRELPFRHFFSVRWKKRRKLRGKNMISWTVVIQKFQISRSSKNAWTQCWKFVETTTTTFIFRCNSKDPIGPHWV